MDDDSKKILLLKIGVGFLVFLAILVVIGIILAVKNGNKKQDDGYEATTRRTISGFTSEEVVTGNTNESTSTTVETTSTTEVTSSTSTTTTTARAVVPTNPNTTRRTTKRVTQPPQTQAPQPTTPVVPEIVFTEITSSNRSNYANADSSFEWSLVNIIQSKTSSKYKVAAELRTAAEQIAEVCCNSGKNYCNEDATQKFNELGYNFFRINYNDYGSGLTASQAYSNIKSAGRSVIESGKYKWVGVGVIKNPKLGGTTCYSVVMSYDN